MLEGFMDTDGKVYFMPNSIHSIILEPISYRECHWQMSFIDHGEHKHNIMEGKLNECCELLDDVRFGGEVE